ncbi:hypothetical protein [Sphingobacterium griseoflavum]|uniref:Uncharacterized protein n=1 Tax=Sphingobacterium griseoflavum TaxID=1474952 RepID=A0ABQ3HU52_9SPHI|nr:hypothetical protein [Sphingobacterium griseoflavum]GHE34992.1 hypothetical protein GCM10017764_17730 [Sphingobacterium griseoflavum]
MKNYNVVFNDYENSNDKGFELSLEEAKAYVAQYNGTEESYFADYKGGVVQIVDNESGDVVHEEEVF